jgi:hypothetical protein
MKSKMRPFDLLKAANELEFQTDRTANPGLATPSEYEVFHDYFWNGIDPDNQPGFLIPV